jgi:hypothetical protein
MGGSMTPHPTLPPNHFLNGKLIAMGKEVGNFYFEKFKAMNLSKLICLR